MPFVWKHRWTKCGDDKQSNQLFVRPQHRISGKKCVFKRSGAQGHMLGSVSCRLLVSSKPSSLSYLSLAQSSCYNSKLQSVKVALPLTHPSRSHVHSFKLISRPAATASLLWTIRRPQSPGQNAYSQKNAFSSSVMDSCGHQLPYSPVKAIHPHSSSCLLAGNGSVGPTIWHALLPARHLTPLEQDPSLPPKCAVVGEAGLGSRASAAIISGSAEATVGKASSNKRVALRHSVFAIETVSLPRLGGLNGRFAMAVGLREGSWNVAWDVRPARWLHGRHSAWLLFGVCACFSAAAGASIPLVGGSVPVLTEALAERQTIPPALPEDGQQGPQPGHGKKVYSDYSVIGIPGDGRCLFRAVAHGSCVSSGQQAPNETRQRELADELRNKVVDELIKRRDSTEWFIEGDFDKYVKRMRQPHVWGGEPELLMLSHVLEMPITVYMAEEQSKGGGIIAIAEYGQDYSKGKKPVRVLYHGFGHYDALHLPNEQLNANL